jgi:hypothetical protein
MTFDEFQQVLMADGPAEALTLRQIEWRVGRPAKEDLFDMVGIVDGEVVSMAYPVDEGTAYLAGVKGFVDNENVLFDVKVTLAEDK